MVLRFKNVLCNHPKLNLTEYTDDPDYVNGISASMVRERFDSSYQADFYRNNYKELCGRKGVWFEPIT